MVLHFKDTAAIINVQRKFKFKALKYLYKV